MTVDTQGAQPVVPAERPRGLYPARVDNKGRLKLPSAFQKYLEALQLKNFFITTLDATTVYIYSLEEWKRKEEQLENPADEDQFELFESISWTANKFGADASIDGEGRMLLPQELRTHFKMQDSPVWLLSRQDAIQVLNEDEYKARERAADPQKLARGMAALKLKDKKS